MPIRQSQSGQCPQHQRALLSKIDISFILCLKSHILIEFQRFSVAHPVGIASYIAYQVKHIAGRLQRNMHIVEIRPHPYCLVRESILIMRIQQHIVVNHKQELQVAGLIEEIQIIQVARNQVGKTQIHRKQFMLVASAMGP